MRWFARPQTIRGLDRRWHRGYRCIASNRKIDRRVSLETKSRADRRYFIASVHLG